MSVLTGSSLRPLDTAESAPMSRHVFVLSWLVAFVGAATAALTFFLPDVLQGPAVSNGNARGTALVMLVLATPLLLLSMWQEQRGSWQARYVWLGSLFYFAYNAFLFLFLTPFNSLFLLYVATESLALFAIFSLVAASRGTPTNEWAETMPVRTLSFLIWTIVVLNALAWFQVVVPAMFSDNPGEFLEGLGVATNAIYVQDLTVWLPVMAVSAWWMWNRRSPGIFLTGAWMAFGVLEGIGVAVDQWFGHRADPLSPHASEAAIPLMIGLAVVNLIGLYLYMRQWKRSKEV